MPSAPSVSDPVFGSRTIYLTTWDAPLSISSNVYIPGVLAKEALDSMQASSDASKGNGGYGEALSGKIYFANRCSLGLLKPLVDSGEIPLIGSAVTIMDEDGSEAPNTWYLEEVAIKGALLQFNLLSKRYLDSRPLAFPAKRSDGYINVGVAVGDASVNDIAAYGPGNRYKGVSVPTKSVNTFEPINVLKTYPWNFGNPVSQKNKFPGGPLYAFRKITTDFSDICGDVAWSSARSAFEFRFENLDDLVSFVKDNLGISYSSVNGFVYSKIQNNSIVAISNGSSAEVIVKSDDAGNVKTALPGGGPPLQGDATACISATSIGWWLETGLKRLWGTCDGTLMSPFIVDGTARFYVETGFLLFMVCGKQQTVDKTSFYAFYVSPAVDGELYGADPENVCIVSMTTGNPICVGASSVCGFQSGSEGESGIVKAPGVSILSGNVLTFTPSSIFSGKFAAWTDIPVLGNVAIINHAISDEGTCSISFGGASGEMDSIDLGIGDKYLSIRFDFPANSGDGFPNLHWTWKFRKPRKNLLFSIDKVFVDWTMALVIGGGGSTFKPKIMAPFFPNAIPTPVAKPAYASTWVIPVFGTGLYSKNRTFDSLEALNNATPGSKGGAETAIEVASYGAARYFQQIFRSLHIYAVTQLSFGENPVIVTPGNWPDTSNPTTTPLQASQQLAGWMGHNIQITGGTTPSAASWGEYLGTDPSSTEAPSAAKDCLHDLAKETWMWVAQGTTGPRNPSSERRTNVEMEPASIDDAITLPVFSYCPAGSEMQFSAQIQNVNDSFDPARGSGYHWNGWQEKDTCEFSTDPGSAVLAVCQLEDCLSIVCADGYLRCSYDGGVTWAFAQQILTSPSRGIAVAGNGVMVASMGGNSATQISFDVGRSWESINIQLATFFGGWYDLATSRLWLCGADPGGNAAAWYSLDGITWTKIVIPAYASARSLIASGSLLCATLCGSNDSPYYVCTSTDLGVTWNNSQASTDVPALGYWDGKFRFSSGSTLYSSADLSAWTSAPLPASVRAFATDGKVIAAIAVGDGTHLGNRIAYSRDQGTTWRLVRVSPEGSAWAESAAAPLIWDDDAYCFRCASWGNTHVLALGDPSVLDIWQRCRASYLRTQTLKSETYTWRGLYDASEVVSWLLDHKDGIDPDQQRVRIDWITQPARFVTVFVEYKSIADQLSVVPFVRMQIPQQRVQNSRMGQGIPNYGLVVKVDHNPMSGWSKIEYQIPPLEEA